MTAFISFSPSGDAAVIRGWPLIKCGVWSQKYSSRYGTKVAHLGHATSRTSHIRYTQMLIISSSLPSSYNLMIHIGEKQFLRFTQYINLQSYHRVHIGEKPFQCKFCHKHFGHSKSLRRHLRIHTGEKPFLCEFCPKRFARYAVCQSHQRVHTEEKPFQCEFCPKRFTQYASCQSHQRVHTGEKPFQCEFCPKRFAHLATRQSHHRVHTGEKPFQCEFCPKRFTQYASCQAHHRVHTGEKPFQCEFCHKHYGHSSNLRRHLRIHKQFRSDSGLYHHLKSESHLRMTEIAKGIEASELNETPKLSVVEYQCEHCSKVCKSACGLKNHLRSHFAHTCQFCGKIFCNADTLQDHLSELYPEKLTFSCRYCLKGFPTDLALQGHVKSSHTKYMCQWCGRSFPKRYLPEHFRIHQQIPHKCEICGKIFTASNYLKKHIKRCHKHWASPRTLHPAIPDEAHMNRSTAQWTFIYLDWLIDQYWCNCVHVLCYIIMLCSFQTLYLVPYQYFFPNLGNSQQLNLYESVSSAWPHSFSQLRSCRGAWNHPLNNYGFIAFWAPLRLWKARDHEHKIPIVHSTTKTSFATPLSKFNQLTPSIATQKYRWQAEKNTMA